MDKYDFLKFLTKKLTNGLSKDEQIDYDIYLQQNKEYNNIEQMITQYYKSPIVDDELNEQQKSLDSIWKRIEGESPAKKNGLIKFQRKLWVTITSVAAAGLIVLSIGYYSSKNSGTVPQVENELLESVASMNEKLLVPMKDGSMITLGKKSEIHFNTAFGEEKRLAKLSGSALFDVVGNAKIPLQIEVENSLVTVKGTSFYIQEDRVHNGYELTLFNGKVELATRNNPSKVIKVLPNQKVQWNSEMNDISEFKISDLDKKTLLQEQVKMQDSIVFKKQTLEDLAIKLSDIYEVKFIFANEQMKKKRFSGMILKLSLKEVMDALKTSYPFDYQIQDTTVIIR